MDNTKQLRSLSLITPLLTTPSMGVNSALSAGMQSSIVHSPLEGVVSGIDLRAVILVL